MPMPSAIDATPCGLASRAVTDGPAARSTPLEEYALLGDRRTAALVSRAGSVDWWCTPRFDSAACFAALLGTAAHGRFLVAPAGAARTTRMYRGATMVLETEHET